jgi:hypothetical protein
MNRINNDVNGETPYGYYTNVVGNHLSFNPAMHFVAGKEYSVMFGFEGLASEENRKLHLYILDECDTIVRHVTMSDTQIKDYATYSKDDISKVALEDTGIYTIYNEKSDKNSFSYEVIPFEKVGDVLNASVENFAYENQNFTWTAVDGAAGYMIKIAGGEWIDVGNVTSYSIADLDLKGEQVANIRAYGETGYLYKVTTITFRMWLDVPIGGGDASTGDVYD